MRPTILRKSGWRRRDFLTVPPAIAAAALASPAPSGAFRFALIGDRTGRAIPGVYSRCWREAHLLRPDFALTIGDTIEGGDDRTAEAEWRAMEEVWRLYRKFPTYYVAGNHDIWSPASRALFPRMVGHAPRHVITHGGALFVLLDNSQTEDLSSTELAFLEDALQRYPSLSPKFVLFHRPFWILHARVGSRAFALHTLARKYGVHHIISGHGHQLVNLELDGIGYLEIGSSGGSIARGTELGQGFAQGWFPHWMWVTVSGGRAEFTVKECGEAGRLFSLRRWGPTGPDFPADDPAPGAPRL